jgi:hypothetical protein
MQDSDAAGRRPRGDGGWVITYDPSSTSFKQACITVVFAGIWLEAAAHLAIVRQHGLAKAKEFDRRSYEDKLQLLGQSDSDILARARRLQAARRELVHEKAHMDSGVLRFAQKEADNAYQLLVALRDLAELTAGDQKLANMPLHLTARDPRVSLRSVVAELALPQVSGSVRRTNQIEDVNHRSRRG